MFADAGPPIVVMAIGLVLWLAVTATVSGISIQTVGVILFVLGAVWITPSACRTTLAFEVFSAANVRSWVALSSSFV